MSRAKEKPGFTLIEMMVAVGVFAIMTTIGAAVFTNVLRMQKRLTLENAVLEDARFMMERLSKMARESTIDYEEYYNQLVVSEYEAGATYGDHYGYYATMFYSPGLNKDEPVGGPAGDPTNAYYGAYYNGDATDIASNDQTIPPATRICPIDRTTRKLNMTNPAAPSSQYCPPDTVTSNPNTTYPKANFDVVLQDTVDYNTGSNPYPASTPGYESYRASAFCDGVKGGTVEACLDGSLTPPSKGYDKFFQQNELYLISQDGFTRTILGREQVASSPDQYVISMVELEGTDTNSNSIPDQWDCGADYNCTITKDGSVRPDAQDWTRVDSGENIYNDFLPISPLRANVVDLKFFVAPLEDPRKGFAENEKFPGTPLPEFMMQPRITIVLTMEPAKSEISGLGSLAPPRITLQTTVTSRVQHEIKSYGP